MGISVARRAKLRARREALRDAQADIVIKLRAEGASCATCQHRDRRYDRVTCALGDEGAWCLPVTMDHLCHQWELRRCT